MSKKAAYALPTRQKETLDYIILHIERYGQSPTYSEIAEALDPPSNKQNVKAFCDELEEKGFIRRDPLKHRSIVVL